MNKLNMPALLLLILLSCTEKRHSELALFLGDATMKQRISVTASSDIMSEHAWISLQDEELAKKYLWKLEATYDLGGDSTAIDRARKEFIKNECARLNGKPTYTKRGKVNG